MDLTEIQEIIACLPKGRIAQRKRKTFYRETLAWARIDLDWETGEALIEEIQSDWVAHAQRLRRQLKAGRSLDQYHGLQCKDLRRLQHYLDHVLSNYTALWDEAMLSAALDFSYRELGLKSVFYHDFKTGAALQGLDDYLPPRSLYSTLPRRFCLQTVTEVPQFLQHDKTAKRVLKRVKNPQFFVLPKGDQYASKTT